MSDIAFPHPMAICGGKAWVEAASSDRWQVLVDTGCRHPIVRRPGASVSNLVSRTFETPRHTTHYLECGPADGPSMMFLHGWPELSLIWRAQMEAFTADGWHCVAPDMRGYGGSSAPATTDAYTNEQIVADMAELQDHLGGGPAIWVGHDWGSVIVGAMVAHHPERCRGAVLVSVPYFPTANALPTLVPLVDRSIYPVFCSNLTQKG